MKTNLCVSAVCKLAWFPRPRGLIETCLWVSKNVIKFKATSPALDSSRLQMFTVSKYFLCETLAWEHLNPKVLHVCLYQKLYTQTHSLPRGSSWLPGSWPCGSLPRTLSHKGNTVGFWTEVFGKECPIPALLTPSFPALLPPPFRVFPWFPPPTWAKSLFYILAQWPMLILCCS